MKIGAIVAVNCDKENIWYCLKGVYNFCDKVVVVYSDTTWTGAKQEDETIDIIRRFEDPAGKIITIEGTYTTQPGQRTIGLNVLRELKYDFAMVVDSDEIYDPSTLVNAKARMRARMEPSGFQVCFYQMWKTLQYKLVPDRLITAFHRITPDLRLIGPGRQWAYSNKRYKKRVLQIPDVVCYHLTCCCSNEYMKEKISTRVYKDVVLPNWFEEKWLKWHPEMRNLHPTKPEVYERAVLADQVRIPVLLKKHRFYK